MCKVSTIQSLIKRYLLTAPPNRQVWHNAFIKVSPGAGPKPTRARRLQKRFGPRRYSPKEGLLRRQAINLTPLKSVKAWGDGPLRLEEIYHPTRMPDSQLKKPLHEAGANQAVFVDRPTKRASVAQGHFKVGPGAESEPRRVRQNVVALYRQNWNPQETIGILSTTPLLRCARLARVSY